MRLGRSVLENDTKINYPERVRGERELLTRLQVILRNKPADGQLKYGPLLDIGGEILKTVGAVQPSEDGHLGFLKIVRQYFGFLQTDYNFSIVDEQPTLVRFSSGTLYVRLKYSNDSWDSCLFGPQLPEKLHFSIYDLLFLNHDERYRTLPRKLAMNTEREVETWFRVFTISLGNSDVER